MALMAGTALASSHREAPFITEVPKVDSTDVYAFRSYETGRAGFVTIIANYIPLQDPYGGPNYFNLDPDAAYEIHIDNNGDSVEDLTFQFRFRQAVRGLTLPVGGQDIPVPIVQTGAIGPNTSALANSNVQEIYSIGLVRGPRRGSAAQPVTNRNQGLVFGRPVDNIGARTIPNYEAYARRHIFEMNIPGCDTMGRVFVGQRAEGFAVNLGQVFDLLNFNTLRPGQEPTPFTPIGVANESAGQNSLSDKNVTALALEVPITCLTQGDEPVIGVWTTASLPANRRLNPASPTGQSPVETHAGDLVQVSRLGSPLVNELVIGLPDKDRFSGSEPANDGQFLRYVTNPTVPALVEVVFGGAGVRAPTLFPRTDLIAAFLTGVQGVNQPANVTPSEMLRLNTGTAPVPAQQQSRLGVIGGDSAGFPNGRRPGEDVVDIILRVAMGRLITLGLYGQPDQAPSGALDFTDGASQSAQDFDTRFPYLRTPNAGSLTP
jgi:hypothetical protein